VCSENLEQLNASLRPHCRRPTILLAQAGESRGAIGSADARSALLDAPSCALKLELSLCLGRAYGKGDAKRKKLKRMAIRMVHSSRNAPYLGHTYFRSKAPLPRKILGRNLSIRARRVDGLWVVPNAMA